MIKLMAMNLMVSERYNRKCKYTPHDLTTNEESLFFQTINVSV